MATYLGGGRAGGSQVRDRTERVGRSCARERFKRPRVSKQTDSLADSAGQCAAEPGDQRRPFTSRMDAMHRRAPPTRRPQGGSMLATTVCFELEVRRREGPALL